MCGSRTVSFCWLSLLLVPTAGFAQSMTSGGPPHENRNGNALVSVRELAIPEKARAAFNKGIEHLAAKDWLASIPEFKKAIKAFPNFYEAYDRMGAAELALASWAEAEAAFRASIHLSKEHYAPPHFGLALVLCNKEKAFEEAETIVRTGLALDPTDKGGNFMLAWILYSASRLQEAEESARDAVFYGPKSAEAWLLLAQIHLREDKWAAVVKDLDSYFALGIESPRDEKIRAIRDQAERVFLGTGSGPDFTNTSP